MSAVAEPLRTDWDAYYRRPFPATRITRRFTEARLVGLIRRFADPAPGRAELVELGGANSCFFERIDREFRAREYHVVDFNRFGLDRMAERLRGRDDVHYHHQDVLNLNLRRQADVVFSIGLIEHFSPEETARAIDAHFALLRPGGTAVISFPTPTPLYRACRGLAEAMGKWAFPDERPLRRPEVDASLQRHGDVLYHGIVWPIILTQMFVVCRKR